MKKVNQSLRLLGCGVLLVILLSACTKEDPQQQKEIQAQQTGHLQQMEKLKQKRVATLEKIKQMQIPELVTQMEQDVKKGREPFNSPAYREVTRNKKTEGASLLQELTTRKEVSYITLLALRSIDADRYKQVDQSLKVGILLSEFGRSESYNKWGLPHLYWEDAAKAVIESGDSAVPGLKKYLTDCKPAPVWGSEEVMEYEAYKYRRCDYALAMLMAIRGENVAEIPKSPDARDQLIKRYSAD